MFVNTNPGLGQVLPRITKVPGRGGKPVHLIRMPIVLRRRGVGQASSNAGITCPEGLLPTGSGGCCDPSNPACASKVSSSPQLMQYPQAPGCYVINLASNECAMENGQPLQCSAIRECDPLTGVTHCQYPLPGQTSPAQTANPSIPFCTAGNTGMPLTTNAAGQVVTGPLPQEQQTLTGGTPYTPAPVNVASLTAAAQKQAAQSNAQNAAQVSGTPQEIQTPSSTQTSAAPTTTAPGASAPSASSVPNSIFSFLMPSGGGAQPVSSSGGGIVGFLETPDPFLGLPYWVWIAAGGVVVIVIASSGKKK